MWWRITQVVFFYFWCDESGLLIFREGKSDMHPHLCPECLRVCSSLKKQMLSVFIFLHQFITLFGNQEHVTLHSDLLYLGISRVVRGWYGTYRSRMHDTNVIAICNHYCLLVFLLHMHTLYFQDRYLIMVFFITNISTNYYNLFWHLLSSVNHSIIHWSSRITCLGLSFIFLCIGFFHWEEHSLPIEWHHPSVSQRNYG